MHNAHAAKLIYLIYFVQFLFQVMFSMYRKQEKNIKIGLNNNFFQ